MLPLAWLAATAASEAGARTVYRCVRDGTVSLSTAPEPGSTCAANGLDDRAATLPNLWGAAGTHEGQLYRREQDGRTVYGTRALPGAVAVSRFVVHAPAHEPAHAGLGNYGPPRTGAHAEAFREAAKATGVDDAWLRAIAHAESGFDQDAVSPKGAMGVMQLMPATAAEYGVIDPYSADESIRAGARHLKSLMALYGGDRTLAAAAYNAGVGTVTRYGGVPPYRETRDYVAKVEALYGAYRAALALTATTRGAVGR